VTETPDRTTAFYDAIAAFQRTHRLPGLQHAQIRGLLAEHLARTLPAASSAVPAPATDRAAKADALLLHFAAEAHRRKWAYDRGLDDDGVPLKSEAFDALHRLGEEMRTELEKLRRMADETPQPTPCDQPNHCEDGELCATHEEEKAHADGEHEYCGPTCEVAMPTEAMRNSIIAFGIPGTAGMLDELLRRAASGQLPADETPQPETRPRRGDAFEAWLKAQRDEYEVRSSPQWIALDEVLDTYRLHADTGTPLGEHVCEGRMVGDCECLETGSAVQPPQPETPVHAVPVPGSNGISSCCGRPPCEFVGERVTRDPNAVTCQPAPAVVAQPDEEA